MVNSTQVEAGAQPSPRVVPWVPVAATIIGVGYAALAIGYGMGSSTAPGPGTVPFFVGAALAVAGAVVSVTERRASAHETDHATATEDASSQEAASRFGVLLTLGLVAAICAFVIWQSRIVGLLPAVGIAAAATAWIMRTRLVAALLTGLGFFLIAYLVFEQWLQVPLPHGYF